MLMAAWIGKALDQEFFSKRRFHPSATIPGKNISQGSKPRVAAASSFTEWRWACGSPRISS